jgi:D-alanine-D-alanine ligase
LHLQGVIRVDFLMDCDANKIYVNEVNTIPGSMAHYLFESEGISFTQLLDHLIQDVLYKERIRKQQITSYDTNLLANFDASKGVKGK